MFTLEQHSNIISKIGIRTFRVEKMDNLFSTLDSMQIGGEIALILTGLNAWLVAKNKIKTKGLHILCRRETYTEIK